jgi:ribosomal protein S18 acetylase RimI-like enzyme
MWHRHRWLANARSRKPPAVALSRMLVVEQMGPDSWKRVRAIRLRALHDSPDAFWLTADEETTTTPAQWRRRLERPDAAMFVASRDGVDVGLVVAAPHYRHEVDAGLYGLWVAPQARGTGVGVALVGSVITWARAAGYRSVRLDVADTNAHAVRLYERMGFVPTGVTATWPPPRTHISEHERIFNLQLPDAGDKPARTLLRPIPDHRQ